MNQENLYQQALQLAGTLLAAKFSGADADAAAAMSDWEEIVHKITEQSQHGS